MSRTANITSIPAIREFKVALLKFQDEGRSSMEVLQIEIQRVLQWIEQDRPAYWATQTRRAFDLVAQTRAALKTCQMRTVAGHRPSCIEEKQAHAAAKRRLQHCQEQIRRVKQWGVKLHQERDEFGDGMGRVAALPFLHAFGRLRAIDARPADQAARVLHGLYLEMARAFGCHQPGRPYNLLLTRDWMLFVPRRRASWNDVGVNALGFAGALMVSGRERLERIQQAGPLAVLSEVAIPAVPTR